MLVFKRGILKYRKETLEARTRPYNKHNPVMTPSQGIKPGHWWEASALPASPKWDGGSSQDTQHEVTRSITTPPGWDASPSQDTQHEVTRSIPIPPWMGC